MFTVHTIEKVTNTVRKHIRTNMKVNIQLYGSMDKTEYLVTSTIDGVLVLRSLLNALDIIAADDLSAFYKLLASDSMSVEYVTVVVGNNEYTVNQDGSEIYYLVEEVAKERVKGTPKVGSTETVIFNNNETFETTVVGVNDSQLIIQLESGDFVMFDESELAQLGGELYELHDINWKEE